MIVSIIKIIKNPMRHPMLFKQKAGDANLIATARSLSESELFALLFG